MGIFIKVLFYVSGFIIFWAMIGYPVSLKLIGKCYKSRKLEKDYNHRSIEKVISSLQK